MSDPTFRSDIRVRAVPDGTCGSDRLVALRAWAESPWAVGADRDDTPEGHRRVIRAMVRGKHTTPFEAGKAEYHMAAPSVVWWQLTRQRFMGLECEDFGANVESGRYRVLEGVFYLPPRERPCSEPDGFKPIRPELAHSEMHTAMLAHELIDAGHEAWARYERLIAAGVAREEARFVLPYLPLYVSGYFGGNPLTVLTFLEQRTRGGGNPSYPQWEIEQAARQVEELFRDRWPVVHAEWVANGRRFGGSAQ